MGGSLKAQVHETLSEVWEGGNRCALFLLLRERELQAVVACLKPQVLAEIPGMVTLAVPNCS